VIASGLALVAHLQMLIAAKITGPGRTNLNSTAIRALGVKANSQVRLLSRNSKDFTKRFTSIAHALEALPDETAIDGEIVAYGADGRPSFNVLQNHRGAGGELHLYAFDLLTLRGEHLTQ
jgi:ATP-dependent DNA ligase